jgi:hypothetical protein
MQNRLELTEEEKLAEKEAENFTPLDKEKRKRVDNIIEQTKKEKGDKIFSREMGE